MIKGIKNSMIFDWTLITILFFLALMFLPQYSDKVSEITIFFLYTAVMFGITWKFMWKLLKNEDE